MALKCDLRVCIKADLSDARKAIAIKGRMSSRVKRGTSRMRLRVGSSKRGPPLYMLRTEADLWSRRAGQTTNRGHKKNVLVDRNNECVVDRLFYTCTTSWFDREVLFPSVVRLVVTVVC